jgi:hypothetical protein
LRYRSPRSTRPRPTAPGGYRHRGHVGQQTGENPAGLPVTLPPLTASNLSAYLGGGLPVLMAGELNAKHVERNSRLITKRSRPLRGYADKNSCLIYGPITPTTIPYNPSATPDVLDIAITKDLVSPIYLTTCSALSSDHLPIPIDTQCRSSFLSPPDRPALRRTHWPKFQACLLAGLPPNPDLPN